MVISEAQQMPSVLYYVELLFICSTIAYTRQIVHAHILSSMHGTMYVLTSAYAVNTDKNYGINNVIIDYRNNYYELLLL